MDNSPKAKSQVIATPEVWLEGEAIRQLEQIAATPDCVVAVGMPDLHPGPGIPIGAAFGFTQTIHPRLVGSDAGCGALMVGLSKVKRTSSLERRIRSEFAAPPDVELGLESEVVMALGQMLGGADEHCPDRNLIDGEFGAALGTIGGGNHFAEIAQVRNVVDESAANQLGLSKGSLVLLCHSGSRGLGKSLADRWGHDGLKQEQAGDYLTELAGALRFARANRVLLAWRLLRALGVARPSKLACAFDAVHNDVSREVCDGRTLWVHRKGCAPAHDGQLAAVLGSRGAPSWIMRGRGNPIGLSSIAHGAGRKMQRSEARDKIRARYRRKQLHQVALGGRVICDNNRLLYEEHPDAYKDIEPVIDSLVRAQLADRIVSLEPLFTVKK